MRLYGIDSSQSLNREWYDVFAFSSILVLLACIPVSQVQVSTRNPQTVRKDVVAMYDNAKVASSSNLLILCVRHVDTLTISQSIRGSVHKSTAVISIVAGMTLPKIANMCGNATEIVAKVAIDAHLFRACTMRPQWVSTTELKYSFERVLL